MSLILVSAEVAPVTLKLALKFRDMQSLKGERKLQAVRAKNHAKLLAKGMFFTPIWGECRHGRTLYRGNGYHTSHLLAACLQQATSKGLDDRSREFVKSYLLAKGPPWTGSPEDLPEVKDGDFSALVESFKADTEADLLDFFRRYDAKESVRVAADLFGIHKGGYSDLDELEQKKVQWACAGVRRAAKNMPAFGLSNDPHIWRLINADPGSALKHPKLREASRWIVETVPDEDLYKKVGAAQVFAEVWATHGEAVGELIVVEIMRRLDEEVEESSRLSAAAYWYGLLTNSRKPQTIESLVKAGRCAVREAVARVLPES